MNAKLKTCWVCHASVNEDDNYCWRCGHEQKDGFWELGFTKTVVHDGWVKNPLIAVRAVKTCPECDYGLDHKHQRFCPGCGRALKWCCLEMWRGGFHCRAS